MLVTSLLDAGVVFALVVDAWPTAVATVVDVVAVVVVVVAVPSVVPFFSAEKWSLPKEPNSVVFVPQRRCSFFCI